MSKYDRAKVWNNIIRDLGMSIASCFQGVRRGLATKETNYPSTSEWRTCGANFVFSTPSTTRPIVFLEYDNCPLSQLPLIPGPVSTLVPHLVVGIGCNMSTVKLMCKFMRQEIGLTSVDAGDLPSPYLGGLFDRANLRKIHRGPSSPKTARGPKFGLFAVVFRAKMVSESGSLPFGSQFTQIDRFPEAEIQGSEFHQKNRIKTLEECTS
ncbi:hypothetical protein B0H13DRAFT_1917659 [Mycena leptocephala]|nr:hypothetical protein B0H13DRAFT_1917659 [Mycena leptocephala]